MARSPLFIVQGTTVQFNGTGRASVSGERLNSNLRVALSLNIIRISKLEMKLPYETGWAVGLSGC